MGRPSRPVGIGRISAQRRATVTDAFLGPHITHRTSLNTGKKIAEIDYDRFLLYHFYYIIQNHIDTRRSYNLHSWKGVVK
jgi:hypothetical protein